MKKIGFIGQGWIGKNYAANFTKRGYEVIPYSKEKEFENNKDLIKDTDIVFIAVPTPTTVDGFDGGVVRDVLSLVGKGKIAVIKSTMTPGFTNALAEEYPDIFVIHSPEFLSRATAAEDADKPERNIIGIPHDTPEYKKCAEEVLSLLPKASYELICSSTEAEMVKYSHNISGFYQVMLYNILYDAASKAGCQWEVLQEAFHADSLMSSERYSNPHDRNGRGAGGDCFIKDVAAFIEVYKKLHPDDTKGLDVLKALEKKNIELLVSTDKDLSLLRNVYGEEILKSNET